MKAWNTIFRRVCQLISILSLDILAGVFCGYTFARLILNGDCPPATPLILCGTVWLIYTLDHLLDARTRKEKSGKPAYRWHWEHRKILWPILLAAGAGIATLSLLCLPARALLFGCITGSMVILYSLVHLGMPGRGKRYLFRECWISILYTAGIWGVPLLFHRKVPDIAIFIAVLVYGLLVLINVLTYSYHEYQMDMEESQLTLATVFGRKTVRLLLGLLFSVVLALIMMAFLLMRGSGMEIAFFILLGMTGVLGLIQGFPQFFHKYGRYGILADMAFLLPGLLFWMG